MKDTQTKLNIDSPQNSLKQTEAQTMKQKDDMEEAVYLQGLRGLVMEQEQLSKKYYCRE